MRNRLAAVLALAVLSATPTLAQAPRRVAVHVGATLLPLVEVLGGVLPAFTAGGTVDLLARPSWGAGLGARAVAPLGAAAAIPGCIAGVPCIEYRSLTLATTVGAYGYWRGGEAVRVSGGGGWMQTAGGRGSTHASTAILEAGIEYTTRRSGRVAPLFRLDVVRGMRAAGSVQTLVLPAVGLRF